MYNIIKNPETNRNVSIYSKKGIAILEKYLNNLTGGGGFQALTNFLYRSTTPKATEQETLKLEDIFTDHLYKENFYKLLKIIEIYKSDQNKDNLVNLVNKINPWERTQTYLLYKNMLYFFILSGKLELIKNLYDDNSLRQKINIIEKYNEQNNNFFKEININHLKKNDWNYEVKKLIYRFHLTNIISVLFILIRNLSDLKRSRPSALSDLKIDELTNEVTDNINKLSHKKNINLNKPSSNNVKSLIKINFSLIKFFDRMFEKKNAHIILKACNDDEDIAICSLTKTIEFFTIEEFKLFK